MSACERLVVLCGEQCPWERRDLGVLLCHFGLLARARAELKAYAATAHASASQTPLESKLLNELVDQLDRVLKSANGHGKAAIMTLDNSLETTALVRPRASISISW